MVEVLRHVLLEEAGAKKAQKKQFSSVKVSDFALAEIRAYQKAQSGERFTFRQIVDHMIAGWRASRAAGIDPLTAKLVSQLQLVMNERSRTKFTKQGALRAAIAYLDPYVPSERKVDFLSDGELQLELERRRSSKAGATS